MASFGACDVKEIVYTNLMLLGFDPEEAESKYKMTFSKDMFDLPNRRAMEVILHFLFSRMDSSLAKQELRDCWPILDKKQEQVFRKACSNWLSELAKDPASSLPRVTASTLMSPGGERFYVLLLHVTTYALRKAISQEFHSTSVQHVPVPPSHADKSTAVYDKLMQSRTLLHTRRFLQKTQELKLARNEWGSFAMELSDRHRELSKRLRTLEDKIQTAVGSEHARLTSNLNQLSGVSKEKLKVACQVHGAKPMKARQEIRRHNINEFRKLRSQLEDFLGSQIQSRDVLDSVLLRNENCMDAASGDFKIPDVLLKERSQALQSTVTRSTLENGQVNLQSAVQVCDVAISRLLDDINKGFPDPHVSVSHLSSLVELHRAQLASVRALRKQLAGEYIPELENAIRAAKERLKAGIHTPCKPVFRAAMPSLDLVSASPGLSFPPPGDSTRTVTPLLNYGYGEREQSSISSSTKGNQSSQSESSPVPLAQTDILLDIHRSPVGLASASQPSARIAPITSLGGLQTSLFQEHSTSPVRSIIGAPLLSAAVPLVASSGNRHVQDTAMLQRWEQRLQQIRTQQHASPPSAVTPASGTPAYAHHGSAEASSQFPGSPALASISSVSRDMHVPTCVQDDTFQRWAQDLNRLRQHSAMSSSPLVPADHPVDPHIISRQSPLRVAAAATSPTASEHSSPNMRHQPSPRYAPFSSTAGVPASPATALVDRLLASPGPQSSLNLQEKSIGEAWHGGSAFQLSHSLDVSTSTPAKNTTSPYASLAESLLESLPSSEECGAPESQGTASLQRTQHMPTVPATPSFAALQHALASESPSLLNSSGEMVEHNRSPPDDLPTSTGNGEHLMTKLHDWQERLQQLRLSTGTPKGSPRVVKSSQLTPHQSPDRPDASAVSSSPHTATSAARMDSRHEPVTPGWPSGDRLASSPLISFKDLESPFTRAKATPITSVTAARSRSRLGKLPAPVTPSFAALQHALADESALSLDDDLSDIAEQSALSATTSGWTDS